jgi:hypothetical protein
VCFVYEHLTDKEYLAKLSKGAIVTQPLDLSLNRPGKKRNRFMPMTKEEVAQQQQQQQQQQAASAAAGSSAAAGMSSYAASVSSPGGSAPATARAGMGMGGGGLPTAQQGSPNSKVGKTAYGQSPTSAQNLATSSTGFGAAPSHNNPYAQQSHAQQMHSPVVKQEPSSGPQSPSMGMGMRPAAPNFNGTVQPQPHPPQHPQQPQQQSLWNATSATTVAPPPPPPAAAAPAPHSNWQAALQSSTAHSMGLAHPPQQPQQPQAQAQPPSHPTSNPYASSRPSIAPQQSHFGGSSSSSMSSTAAASPSTSAIAHAGLFPSAPAANQTYVPSSMARPTPAAFTASSSSGAMMSSSSASSTMTTTAAGIISSSSRVDDDLDDDALLHMAERHSPQKPKPMDGTTSNSHSTTAAASTTAAGSMSATSASHGVTDGAKRTLSMQPQPPSSVAFGEERKDGSPAAVAVGIGSGGPFFTQQPRNVATKPPSPPQPRVLTSADLLGDPEHEPTASRSL